MQVETETERKVGRPSCYPVRVAYNEDAAINAAMHQAAARQGFSFSELQRIINRAGLQALNLTADA